MFDRLKLVGQNYFAEQPRRPHRCRVDSNSHNSLERAVLHVTDLGYIGGTPKPPSGTLNNNGQVLATVTSTVSSITTPSFSTAAR